MNYTVNADEQQRTMINAKVKADLALITARVSELLGKRLYALLLCGGFGRGEGSVVVDGADVHIVNDYDFTVVLNARNRFHYLKLYREIHAPLEKLAGELARELDIKQVDLSPKPRHYFKGREGLKIENYEVKMGHVLLYGDRDPTVDMPAWQAADIPLFEGTWLFRNRGTGLLLAALYFMTGGEVPASKKENFVIEGTKAGLAIGDAILLLNRQYHHLYHKRGGILNALDMSVIPGGQAVRTRYREALAQKLDPDFSRYAQRDLRKWWFEVRADFERFFRFYEQKRLGVEFDSWMMYAGLAKPENRLNLKMLAGKIIKSSRQGLTFKKAAAIYRKSKKSFSISLVALVLFALREDSFDTRMMAAAAEHLNVTLSGNPKKDWLRLAKAVLTEIHPGGEVGKMLAQ